MENYYVYNYDTIATNTTYLSDSSWFLPSGTTDIPKDEDNDRGITERNVGIDFRGD